MTLGERSLEREVLALFDRQAEMLLPRIRLGESALAAASVHTLKGSARSEEHTSELQSPDHLVCRLLLEKKKKRNDKHRKRGAQYCSSARDSSDFVADIH